MSTYLWKYYFENDVEKFRQVLAHATDNASTATSRGGANGTTENIGALGNPGTSLATSPILSSKSRKSLGWSPSLPSPGAKVSRSSTNVHLTRADINARDFNGVTLLHYIASSASDKASQYAAALLPLPMLDMYIQDLESGWTALHRALYFGNITIARALMDRDSQGVFGHNGFGTVHGFAGLIKIKDREGNSPFDVYGASITTRDIRQAPTNPLLSSASEEEEHEMAQGVSGDPTEEGSGSREITPRVDVGGDEVFTFGSNKNFTLGFGDEDDRQYPERIFLKRPEHLLRRLHSEFGSRNLQAKATQTTKNLTPSSPIPALIQYQPIIIQDIQLSKLHSAVLTTDPEANLYMCGFGPGGRLGTGDEATRFHFTSVSGGALSGKKVANVGLGQNHTLAITNQGETFTWGSNTYGQLGYASPTSNLNDEELAQLSPRQVFGPLKREVVVAAAASRTHSVVHTATSLYTFGKNEGQLGLVDSDARSLVMQNTPRKVAAALFSSPINSVSAIDKATICLLENHDVWIFANYGYTKMSFPLEGFSNYFLKSSYSATRYSSTENHICKITSGDDTICAMSNMGDVFTVNVSLKTEASHATASTTNPSKIRGALAPPQRVWSLRKSHMAVRDVDVGQDGSIIISTESGSVWRRVKRAKAKDANALGSAEYKPKDYKFSRVPGLTRIAAVRSNTFGSYATIRRDYDVLKTQIEIDSHTLWKDLYPLHPFQGLTAEEDSDTENPMPRFWTPSPGTNDIATIRRSVLTAPDVEESIINLFADQPALEEASYDLRIGSTTSKVLIPAHEFVLAGRSSVLRRALTSFRQSYFFSIPDVVTIEYDSEGKALVLFQGTDCITLINLILYLYTDSVVDVWHHTRHAPKSAGRYRQIRADLMRIASHLDMRKLEQAVRVMVEPPRTLNLDMDQAIQQPEYFENGDVEIELDGDSAKVHSALICQRCPFFEGLFRGRTAGLWLSSRREQAREPQEVVKVDLKHVDPGVFKLVLRHIYADSNEEIFNNTVTTDFDAFLDLIMEVMSVANELMLDRLAQVCQKMLGRYVNTRNVCQLLNAVAPCSVTQFKDAALEYICMNLEGMLENHLLNELDDDLMLELDEVVRQNQLTCQPFAKSGRAEADLHERYPELDGIIERSRRAKVDSMALRSRLQDDEMRFSGSAKARVGFSDDSSQSPSVQKSRRRSSKDQVLHAQSPSLKAKSSAADLMFEMDEGEESDTEKARTDVSLRGRHGQQQHDQLAAPSSELPTEEHWMNPKGKALPSSVENSVSVSPGPWSESGEIQATPSPRRYAPLENIKPWGSSTIASSKLDMKDIMAQATSNRVSNISAGLSLRAQRTEITHGNLSNKLSQRERKKQQLQQAQQQHQVESLAPPTDNKSRDETPSSPWQVASRSPKISLKDVLGAESNKSPSMPAPSTSRTSSIPSLTLRQTVAGNPSVTHRSTSSSSKTQKLSQQRSVSSPSVPPSTSSAKVIPSGSSSATENAFIQSIRHAPPPVEPSLQLSMADILSQQQAQKDIIKEAAAKRSLQEIQEEQAFQEWWDEESRKVRAEEEAARAKASGRVERGERGERGAGGKARGGGRGKGRGRGGGRRGTESGSGSGQGRGGKAHT